MGSSMTAQVVPLRKKRPPPRERRLKRLAMQIAVQLPDDRQEALDVLEHAKTLVRAFVGDSSPV